MIEDRRQIRINAPPETVFALIETMPNKFPVYKIMDAKPVVFLRLALVDGLRSAIKANRVERPVDRLVLRVGDSMAPFELTEVVSPTRYWLALRSFFFNCRTGYTLNGDGTTTVLHFDTIAENPKPGEKLYWFLVKPFHILLARKVLRVIKQRAEANVMIPEKQCQ